MYNRLFKRLSNKMIAKGISETLTDNLMTLFHTEAERTNQSIYYDTGLVILDRNGIGLSFKNMVLELIERNPQWYAGVDVKKFVKKWASTEMGNKYYEVEPKKKRDEKRLRVGDVLRIYFEDYPQPSDEVVTDIKPGSWSSDGGLSITTIPVKQWNGTGKVQHEYLDTDRWEKLGRVMIDVNKLS